MQSIIKTFLLCLISFIAIVLLMVFFATVLRMGQAGTPVGVQSPAFLTDIAKSWYIALILACSFASIRSFLSTGKKTLHVITLTLCFFGLGIVPSFYSFPAEPVRSEKVLIPAKNFIISGKTAVYASATDSLTIDGIIYSYTSKESSLNPMYAAKLDDKKIQTENTTLIYQTNNPLYESFFTPDSLSRILLQMGQDFNTTMERLSANPEQKMLTIFFIALYICFSTTLLRSTRSLLSNIFLYLGFIWLLIAMAGIASTKPYETLGNLTSTDLFPRDFPYPMIVVITVFFVLHLILRLSRSRARKQK